MSLHTVFSLLVALLTCCNKGSTSSNCNRPEWNRFVDQSSAGANRHSGPVSIQDCLDYCVETPSCVAVDVQVNIFPPGCWPHFNTSSLVDSNTFFLPGTNQYRLVTRCSSQRAVCNESQWERYYGYTAVGASEYVGPRTIRQCLEYCEKNDNCFGVDIDVNLVPLRCWPHLNRANLRPSNVFQQQNTSHYRLINRCPNATKTATKCYNPEWTVHENQNSVGASQYGAAQSVQECLDYCGSQSDCVAADVDLTKQPPTCWPHLSKDAFLRSNVFSTPGTNQYRLRTRCINDTAGGNCRDSVWKLRRDTTALGGTRHVGPRTIQQCLDYCNATAACVAVDINVNVVPVGCWVHVNASNLRSDNIYSQPGTYHYQITKRCNNTRTVCYSPDWQVLTNQNSVGASHYGAAQSVQECLDYCGSQSDCVAADVDMTKQPPACWPHFSKDALLPRNVFSQPGTNQYRLRTGCASPITESPTSTTSATTTLGSNCRQSAWKRLDGSTALGGQLHVGPRTIQQCLDYCNATSSCVAVDVDVNVVPLRCWVHVNASDLRQENIYGQQGTYHYQLITRCFNPPEESKCYNPEWETLADQNSVGANQYHAARSVQECLDYCGSQSDCVAADVDLTQQPPACWPHLSKNALLPNTFSQLGTNQYRLKTRCVNDTAAATTEQSAQKNTTLAPTTTVHSAWKNATHAERSGVIIGLAVGLGVPLFILLVVVIILLCCVLGRWCDWSGKIRAVEAINPIWKSKTLESRPATMRSSASGIYPDKDGSASSVYSNDTEVA